MAREYKKIKQHEYKLLEIKKKCLIHREMVKKLRYKQSQAK